MRILFEHDVKDVSVQMCRDFDTFILANGELRSLAKLFHSSQ